MKVAWSPLSKQWLHYVVTDPIVCLALAIELQVIQGILLIRGKRRGEIRYENIPSQ